MFLFGYFLFYPPGPPAGRHRRYRTISGFTPLKTEWHRRYRTRSCPDRLKLNSPHRYRVRFTPLKLNALPPSVIAVSALAADFVRSVKVWAAYVEVAGSSPTCDI